jgi:hypothetical protein
VKLQLQNEVVEIDLIEAETVIGKISAKLNSTKGKVHPTIATIAEVATWLTGFYRTKTLVSIAEAWQVWFLVSGFSETARDQQANNAELAYWFKVNPLELTELQKMGLMANLPRMMAQDRISRGDYSATDVKGVYQLFLSAYGDEDLAQKRATEAAKAAIKQEAKANQR